MSGSVPEGRAERRGEVALAGHLGDHATARAALTDADPEVRATALGALERTGTLDDTTVDAALADPDPAVRRRACEVAGHRPQVSLLGVLDDPDPSVVEVAAWACGEQAEHAPPGAGVVGRLVVLAEEHDDPLVREAAVAALGAIGDPSGLPAILRATRDRPAIRRRAVIALAPFDGDEVDQALQAALTDRDWQVRQAAEDLLAAG